MSKTKRGRLLLSLLGSVAVLVALLAPATVAQAAPTESPANLAPNGDTVSNNPVITWDAIEGVKDYRIDLADNPGFNPTTDSRTVPNTAYTYPNELAPGTYYVRVAGVSGGTGPFAQATFTKDEWAGPGLVSPADAAIFRYPDEPASLSWEPIAGARSYIVEVDDAADFLGASVNKVNGPAITFLDTPPIGQLQYWRVRGASGNNGSGELTSWSPEVRTFTVTWPDVPLLRVPANGSTVTDVEMEWDPVPGADRYDIQVARDSGFTDIVMNRNDLIGTRVVPFETFDNGSYWWRIRSKTATGFIGDWSAVHSYNVGWPGLPTLSAPTNGRFVSDLVQFSWTPVVGASHYELQVGQDVNFSNSTYKSCFTAQTHVTEVSGGKDAPGGCSVYHDSKGVRTDPGDVGPRFWRVRGIDGPTGRVSLWSATQAIDPEPRLRDPSFVAELESPADAATVGQSPVLQWAPMDSFFYATSDALQKGAIERYEVTVKDKDGVVVATGFTESTSFVPATPLDPTGSPFTWHVKPEGWTLPGAYAGADPIEYRSFTVVADTPVASPTPTSPAPGAADRELPAFAWTPVTAATHYVIEVRPDGNVTWQDPFGDIDASAYSHDLYPFVPTPSGACSRVLPANSLYTCNDPTSGVVTFPASGLFVPGTYEWRVTAYDGASPLATGSTSTFEILDFDDIAYQAPLDCQPGSPCTAVPSSPVFDWEPDPRADYYLVTLAFDPNFTNIDRTYELDQSTFIPREELPDNDVGQAYYWHVRPCMIRRQNDVNGNTYNPPVCSQDPQGRPAPSSAFQKRSAAVVPTYPPNGATVPESAALYNAGCVAAPGQTWDQRCTVRFQWEDYLTSNSSDIGAKQYRIQVSTTPAFEQILDDEQTDQTFYTPETKSYPPGPLYWRVRAIDASNNNLTWSPVRTFTFDPPPPTLQLPAPGASLTGVPSFSWEVLPFASRYRVEIYKNGDLNASPANRVFNELTQHTELTPYSALPIGTYAWRVTGETGDQVDGVPSVPRLFTLTGDAPSLATPIDEALLDQVRVLFTWSSVPGAARYQIQVSDSPAFGTFEENEKTVMQAWAPRGNIPTGTYYWRVHALDGADNIMGTSTVRMFTRDTRDLPSEPTAVNVVNGPGTVQVSWSPPVHAGNPSYSQYQVTISGPDGLGGTHTETQTMSSGIRTATFRGVLNGFSHDVTIQAKAGNDLGDPAEVTGFPNGCAGTPFADVGSFCNEIAWLYTQNITNGTTLSDGTRLYKPTDAVSRQAMAAFLHRYDGDQPPANLATPYFADVGPTHPFYADIQWMYEEGISTGTPQPGGKPLYKPADAVSRQAMAAFLHRFEGGTPHTLDRPFFADVPASAPFYNDIQWMAWSGLSTGTPQPGGKPLYKPTDPVSRQAMAAFLFRFDQL